MLVPNLALTGMSFHRASSLSLEKACCLSLTADWIPQALRRRALAIQEPYAQPYLRGIAVSFHVVQKNCNSLQLAGPYRCESSLQWTSTDCNKTNHCMSHVRGVGGMLWIEKAFRSIFLSTPPTMAKADCISTLVLDDLAFWLSERLGWPMRSFQVP